MEAIIGGILGFLAALAAVDYQLSRAEQSEKSAKQQQALEVRRFLQAEIDRNLQRLNWFLQQVEESDAASRRQPHTPASLLPILALTRVPLAPWRTQAWHAYESLLVSALADDFAAVYIVYSALDDMAFLHALMSERVASHGQSMVERQRQWRADKMAENERGDRLHAEEVARLPEHKIIRTPESLNYPTALIIESRHTLARVLQPQYAEFMRLAEELRSRGNPLGDHPPPSGTPLDPNLTSNEALRP